MKRYLVSIRAVLVLAVLAAFVLYKVDESRERHRAEERLRAETRRLQRSMQDVSDQLYRAARDKEEADKLKP